LFYLGGAERMRLVSRMPSTDRLRAMLKPCTF
jgi:hypothetical protein